MGGLKGRPVSAWGFGRGFFRGQKLFFIGAARLLTLFSVGVGGLFLSDFTLEVLAYVFGCGLASSAQNLYLDIPVCLGLLAIAIVPMLIGKKFSKVQGFVMLGIYLTYIVVMALFNPFPAVL